MPIICLEGPSAVGKTSLAHELAHRAGAAVVPEPGSAPPAGADPASWYVSQHVDAWTRAQRLASEAPLVVIDGDPFKGLWYNWVYAADAPSVEQVAALYAREVERGALRFPDLYVVLRASEDQLRARRAADPTRSRRRFQTHLRLMEPQLRYFAELERVAPGHVLWLSTSDREALADSVLRALPRHPAAMPDPLRLLRQLADWLSAHPP